MPIEDVDYLKSNSKEQKYVLLVNSSDRDRSAYPGAENYTITFTVPFHGVTGVEVLDANIPRTMYNIDKYNNTLYFCIYSDLPALESDPFKCVEIDPGDYTVQTLIVALNSILEQNGNVIIVDHLSNPPELKNGLVFNCSDHFMFDMTRSTAAEALGFDLLVDPSEALKPVVDTQYPWKRRRYNTVPGYIDGSPQRFTLSDNTEVIGVRKSNYIETINGSNVYTDIIAEKPVYTYDWLHGNFKLYNSVSAPPSEALGTISTVFEGPRSINRKLGLSIGVAQRFTVSSQGYISNIAAALTFIGDTDGFVDVYIHTDVDGTPAASPLSGPHPMQVEYTDGGYSEIALEQWVTKGDYWVVFRSEAAIALYYNDTRPTEPPGTLRVGVDNVTWSNIDTDVVYYQASIRITKQDAYNYIAAPSPYYLIGQRYIVLRCPEIEGHSHRYLAYSNYNQGLAKFRLDQPGYIQNYSLTPDNAHSFHPIGKLAKLTLRFETSKGQLYDFKGVNHTITFAVYYLEPIQKETFKQSLLNPNYRGDYVSYVFDDAQYEDEDDEYPDEDYQLTEMRHLPESTRRIDQQALYRLS